MSLAYRKKLIVSRIENLSAMEHGEIFKIMDHHKISYRYRKFEEIND